MYSMLAFSQHVRVLLAWHCLPDDAINLFCREMIHKNSAVAEMGDRLATLYMAEKTGGLLCPFRWGAGSIEHNVALAKVHLRTKCHLDPSRRLATIDMGRKLGAVPLSGGSWVPT